MPGSFLFAIAFSSYLSYNKRVEHRSNVSTLISRLCVGSAGAGFFLYFVSCCVILWIRRSRASGWRLFPPNP
nr:MAG TPA: hypothetical protein [Caudoviricetes sp.]